MMMMTMAGGKQGIFGLNCLGTEIHYKFYVIDEVNEMDLAKERGGYELELCSVGKELN